MSRFITSDELGAEFDAASSSVVRVEGCPAYAEQVPASDFYLEEVRRHRAAGVARLRVRLVHTPLTPYERWELEALEANDAAGELVVVAAASYLSDNVGDFWLFDDQVAVAMHYDADGVCDALERIEDPQDVADLTWTASTLATPALPIVRWNAAAAVRRAG